MVLSHMHCFPFPWGLLVVLAANFCTQAVLSLRNRCNMREMASADCADAKLCTAGKFARMSNDKDRNQFLENKDRQLYCIELWILTSGSAMLYCSTQR
jgi:hypothetical protein